MRRVYSPKKLFREWKAATANNEFVLSATKPIPERNGNDIENHDGYDRGLPIFPLS